MSRRQGKRSDKAPKHVRVYEWEMRSAAYQSLSCEARALLVEFRRLYKGAENDNNGEIYFSIRQMMSALAVGQKAAVKARDQLIDRGFVKIKSMGTFNRKVPHATEWIITSEPVGNARLPTKEYMSWEPPQKSTVSPRTTERYAVGLPTPNEAA